MLKFVHVLAALDSAERLTKLDLITYTEAEKMKKIPCNLVCNRCGLQMRTEFDFAAHYTVDDPQYPNLGHCPVRDLH